MFAIHPRRQVREMYAFLFLFSFAASLITIFEPVFFYQAGMSLAKIAGFYAVHYTLYIFALPLGGMFAARFGYERALTASTPLFVFYFLLLAVIPSFPELFWLATIVLTCFKILYWPAYHATFSAFADGKNRGTEQSWIRLIARGAGIVGPLLGGVIIAAFGFPALFILAAALISVAGIPLLRTKEEYHLKKLDYGAPWRLLTSPRHRRMSIAMLGWGENLVHLVMWPVFIFIMVGSVESLGLIASVSSLFVVLWGFAVGELSDRLGTRKMLRVFVPLSALSYAFRMFVSAPLAVAGTDIYSRTSAVSVGIPFLAKLYQSGRSAGPLNYAVAFEIALCIMKAAVAWALVVVFLNATAPVGFVISFALAAALTFFYLAL